MLQFTREKKKESRSSLKNRLSFFPWGTFLVGIYFVLVFTLCLSIQSARADTSNPIGWWKLDDGSGSSVNDSSGNGSVGTIASMTGVTWVTGILGGAINFSSTTDWTNAFVNLGSPTGVVALTSQVSISVWIKADDFISSGAVVCRDPYGDGVFCLKILSSGKPQWYIYQSNGTKITLSPSNVLSTGQWYNIVAVADGSILRTYINGVDTGVTVPYNGTLYFQPALNGRSLAIGATGVSLAHFHGSIDDVRLYSGILTSSDANSLYLSGIRPNVTIQVATSTDTTATLNATIVSNQAASSTIRGFIYGTDTTFSMGITTETGTFNPGTFTAPISGLTCSTIYHVKAYAVNSYGTTTTADQPFEACISDPDMQAYISGVYSNAGTISPSTQSAISSFVSNAKAHGYWSNLIAIGPLAGDQLSAALVQLKYKPGTTQILANHNFISADYSPLTGLQGSSTASSVKWLDSGLNEASTFPSGPLGLAFWSGNSLNVAQGNKQMLAVSNSVGSGSFGLNDTGYFQSGGSRLVSYPSVSSGNKIPYGFIHGKQSSATTSLFFNGLLVNTSTTGSYITKNFNIGIFAGNTGAGADYPTGDNGYYYSFDDGSMSSAQIAQYYSDVLQLMIGLGRVNIGTKPMKMAIITGQSLATGSNGSPILSTVQPYNNKMFLEGSWYPFASLPLNAALSPLTEYNGTSGETIATAMANFVSSSTRSLTPGDASQDLVMENVAEGGWNYDLLALGAEGATGPFAISTSTISKLETLAASQYTTGGVIVPGVLVLHGESNEWDPEYQADIRQWQKDYDTEIKKITGQTQNVMLFHSQTSDWTIGATAPFDMLVQSEIDPTRTLLVTPKYFFQYGTGASGIHLTNVGYRWLGEYYGKAWYKAVVLGQTWSPLRPISEVLNGQNIDITFAGNVGNIVFGTTTDGTTSMPTASNYGFEYYDDATSSSISSVSTTGPNSVRVTLSQVPTGPNKRIRYAYTCSTCTAGGPGNGPYGNLRDSDPTVGNSDSLPLWDWAVHFDKRLSVVIASAIATPSTNSASITVNSGMTASSTRILFGPSTNYGTSTSKVLNSLSSSFTLSNLKPCTIYHYMASSTGPSTLNAPQYDYVPGYATTTIYDLTGGSAMSISDTGTSTDQNFTTTGCTGSASVTASSTNTITTGSGGSLSLGVLSLTVPTSYSGTTTSANFQAKQIDPNAFSAAASTPAGKVQAGTSVINLEALIDATTTLPTFSQPLTVVMSYSPSDIAGILESSLKIYRYDGSTWTALNSCSVNTGAKTVTCQTSNFSDFGMYGDSLTTAPTVTTSSPTLVSTSTMTLNGNITSDGNVSSTIRGFAWGTNSSLSGGDTATTTESPGPFGVGAFTKALTGLTASTTYYFRAYVVNSVGTSTGSIVATSTLQWSVPGAPTGASAATSSPNQATVSFSTPVSNGGSNILYYVASSTPGNFTATSTGSPVIVTGLTNGTSFTFQVYAINAVGTSTASAATSPGVTPTATVVPPSVTTSSATATSTTGATLNGNIASDGNASSTVRGFAWGTNSGLSGGNTATTTDTAGSPFNLGSFTKDLTGLIPNTPYYFRAYAVNSAGTSTGLIVSFATNDITSPIVNMTIPSSGATVAGSAVSLSATATDDVGVVGVQFILDGITNIGSLITSTSSPNTYSTTWNSTGITTYSSHTIYAVAHDATGNYATSTVTVNVDNVSPTLVSAVYNSNTQITVTLSKLANSTTITKSNDGGFTVTKTGSGTTYAVSSIAPGSDNTKVILTTADMTAAGVAGVMVTYAHSGNGTVVDTLGNLLATDNDGQTIPPWNTTAPIISNITSNVSNGAYKAGATIDIDLTFSKTIDSTSGLTANLNSGGSCSTGAISDSTTASCTYTIGGSDNASTLNVSSITGSATSTDGNPMTSFSPAVNLSTNKTIVVDTIAPSVSVTSPSSGATVSGSSVTLTASNFDAGSGIESVQFKLDGTNIGSSGTTNPYTITWDSTSATNVGHTLYAVAEDVAGNYATSSINITVDNTIHIYSIGGSVSGLTGTLILQNNSGDNLTLTSNGSFTFNTSIANGSPYSVTVLTQPSEETCSVSGGSGNVSSSNVTNVSITCTANPVTPAPIPTVTPTTSYSSGGGSVSASYIPITTTTPVVPGCPAGLICTPIPGFVSTSTNPITVWIPASAGMTNSVFTRDLTLGFHGSDVTELQNFLILHNYLGSIYNTGYFGSLTQTALAKYQSDNGITPATGYYGPKTRAFMAGNAVLPSSQTSTPPPVLGVPTIGPNGITFIVPANEQVSFTIDLTLGSTGPDVKDLQIFLNAHGFTVAKQGAGSPGHETTYFGPATKAALIRFQDYYAKDILTPNGLSKGTGYFGPATMKVVNTMMK